jgi:hypothetical protein
MTKLYEQINGTNKTAKRKCRKVSEKRILHAPNARRTKNEETNSASNYGDI